MNRLRIKSRIWSRAPEEFEKDVILTEVFTDGKLLVDFEDNYLATDLLSLERSIHQDGEFFIVTCTCGHYGCAGIREGIRVTRQDKNVHWVVRGLGGTQTFYFDPKEYESAIEKGIKQLQQMVERYGLEVVPDYNLRAIDKRMGTRK
jgi:hypothetical protein